MKTFVIDTTILLHDPSAITKFKQNIVVIPFSVIEELDSMKRIPDERGRNARDVLRYIDSLKAENPSSFTSGVTIPEGPTIKVLFDIKGEAAKSFPLSLDKSSHRTLLIAHVLHQTDKNVVFVSKDFVNRVKAEALGLESEDYENLKVSCKDLQKGLKKITLPKAQIDAFYKDGFLVLERNFFPNEYCILLSEENSSAVCKYNYKNKRLEPLISSQRGVWGLHPLNVEQKCAMDLLLRDDIPLVNLMGPAGTGKTLLALACGLFKVFDEAVYSKILVSRPIVPLGKDIGYLPGTKEEKLYHWMQPIYDNLEYLCQASAPSEDNSAYEWILQSKKIEMEAVTYIRGRSLPKIYMIIDEAQNLTPHEMKTIISRAGKGTKVVLTGDPTQIDNPYLDQDSNGLTYAASKFRGQPLNGHVYLDRTERSELAGVAADIL
jgi:PhoH-like ATPase